MPRANAPRNDGRVASPLLIFFGLLGLFILPAGLLDFAQPAAHAASAFTVNSTGDGADGNTADGLCNDGAGNCTLRAAIQQANATAGSDTIGFSVTGTINLTGALPDILDGLTIEGPGASLLTVRRDTGGDYRIFSVFPDGVSEAERVAKAVSISGLTAANGRTPDGFAHAFGGGGGPGGAVHNGGNLTLTGVTLTGNRTGDGGSIGATTSYGGPGGNGGAVSNFGVMTLTNVTLIGNRTGAGGAGHTAGEAGGGGAVYNFGGTLTMNGCVVRGNMTGDGGAGNGSGGEGGDGGGVYSYFGTLIMSNCDLKENRAGAGGASSGNGGAGGKGGRGGAIYVGHNATLTALNVSGNVTGGGGSASLGTPGAGGEGGGVYFDNGHGVTLTNSTFSGNVGYVGGAIVNMGELYLANTTVSGNRLNGPGGAVRGGFVTNCTITANHGPGLIGGAGATIRNTIVVGNNGGTGPDVSGSFNSQGYNLVGNVGNASGFAAAGDRVGTSAAPLDARLGPLADNGGPTPTHALLPGSPALDAGNNALAVDKQGNPLTTDQRGPGFPRRADSADADAAQTVDIGAFEAHPYVEDVGHKTTGRDTPISFSFGVGDAAFGISVTAASSNQTLVSDSNLSLSGDGPTRTLQITPAAGLSGTTTITLTVTAANGRSMSDSFVLAVDAANAAPAFTKGADQTVAEDSGPQTVNGWATGISPGPPDEAGQSVSFVVTANTNPGLFAAGPSVSPDGALTYTPAANANGSAAVTIVLKDGGGTAGGGQDTSAPQTFNISVTAVNDAPVNSVPAARTTARQTPLVFSGAGALSIADVDAGAGNVRLTLSATHGVLTLGGTAGLTFVSGDGADDASMTFNGTLAAVNAALAGLTFKPEQGYTGAASVQLTSDDQGNTGSGGPKADTDIVAVSVVNGGTLTLIGPLRFEMSEAERSAPFMVLRRDGSLGTGSISYATTGGTATGGAECAPGVDYVNTSGTFNWADGETTDKSFQIPLCDDSAHEADETVVITLSGLTGSVTLATPSATLTIKDDDPSSGRIEFSQSFYSGVESSGIVNVTVRRTGDTGLPASVDYETDDGSSSMSSIPPCSTSFGRAFDRCDYTRAVGRLHFAAGETEKTFQILVTDDTYAEFNETAIIWLSNPGGGAALGRNLRASLEIVDDAPETSVHPSDISAQFVRQHYHDFLNREPDAAGLLFWTDEIEKCGADQQCREVKRINVSAAFFLSIEFQQTGYLVERMYKAAYGDATGNSTVGGSHQVAVPSVRLSEFLPDTQRIGRGVVVGHENWEALLESNKLAFALEFVQRARFASAFPAGMAAEEFVAKLDQNTGGVLSPADKAALVATLGASPGDAAKRAQVLKAAAENEALARAEFNRAFVLMQYFGYLRRDPDAAPDADHTGYDFWLRKLDEFGGNFIQAEMVKAFLNSDEYRKRFGR